MVADKLRGLPDFPPPLRSLVEHMILSHHGQLEFGSPKVPQFPEALLLHYLDDLDSKMECMRALIENDRQVEGCFTTLPRGAFAIGAEERPLSERQAVRAAEAAAARSRLPQSPAEAPAACCSGGDPRRRIRYLPLNRIPRLRIN